MGKMLSVMKRPFKNYNIESRAHKIISREKPTPAPKYKSDELEYERIMKEHPEIYEDSLKKNQQLDKNLKEVYVLSHDPEIKTKTQNPNKSLPVDRSNVEDFDYGVKEPEIIPPGKTTLRKALKFITDHQSDPQINTVKKISTDYILPEQTVSNILKYFKVFELYIPQQRKVKATFAGPSVPRVRITTQSRKQLPPAKINKNEV